MKRTLLVLLFAALPATARAQAPDKAQLAGKAHALLKQYCHRCHGQEFTVEKLDVLDLKSLTARQEDSDPYITPGQPGKSALYRRFGTSMPPKKIRERPTEADRALIRKWIEVGAPAFPSNKARPPVVLRDVLGAVRDALDRADREDRPYLRFFTLAHLHNDARIAEGELRSYRAALAKALNSLSWRKGIVVPRAVDKAATVLAIDLRDLGWEDRTHWRPVLAANPYGLRHDESIEAPLREADKDLFRLAGGVLPYVRADWFVATALRPPLYHLLLDLPNHAGTLEAKLGVDFRDNFRRDRLARAGFAASGVSGQNRLVERHEALHGAYWKSYDFKEGGRRGNLVSFPLGPTFRGNDFDAQAFDHDGGEIIFNLPNGLQGYLLVDGKDRRIDSGPEEVVSDALKTSGTPAIVNGLSCMACHKHGTIPFRDEVRDGTAVGGAALLKVRRLYPAQEAMRKLLAADEKRFLDALEAATGPFLKVGEDRDRAMRDFAEPVGDLARRYKLANLTITAAALELGLTPEVLAGRIRDNRELRELGLASFLVPGATINRAVWDRLGATSLFQRAASAMELGTPYRVVR